jgi:uncharacterized membrane protein
MDLGGYTQALFNLSHFRLPFNTFKNMVMWGDHAHFIITLMAPFYRIIPDARLILVVQALAVTLAGWPLYKIARLIVKNYILSLAILYAYLAFIGSQYALNFDFHPSVLTGALIIWFFYGFHFNKKGIFWTALILGLITREDAPPIFFMIGGYFLLRNIGLFLIEYGKRKWRDRYRSETITPLEKSIARFNMKEINKTISDNWKTGLLVMIISFVSFCIIAYGIMPVWTKDHAALTYLEDGNKDPYSIVRGFFVYPKAIFQNMFDTDVKLKTVKTLFSSFSFLSAFSPFTYISSLTIFYSRFTSADSYRWVINNHSNANIVPLLAIGAIYGASNLRKIISFLFSLSVFTKDEKRKKQLLFLGKYFSHGLLIILGGLLIYSVQINAWSDKKAPLFFSHEKHIMPTELIAGHENVMKKVAELIPQDDMVSVSSGFTAHLGNRKNLQNYPDMNEMTKWLVVSPFAYSWPFSQGTMKHEIKVLLTDHEFEQVYYEKGAYIFKRRFVGKTNNTPKAPLPNDGTSE